MEANTLGLSSSSRSSASWMPPGGGWAPGGAGWGPEEGVPGSEAPSPHPKEMPVGVTCFSTANSDST
eukprot:9197032-Pyramimonas_sp.AAC.1